MITGPTSCPHGCVVDKSLGHIFFSCHIAKGMWFASSWCIRWDEINFNNVLNFLNCLMQPGKYILVHAYDHEKFFIFASLVLDLIWKIKNQIVFEGLPFSLDDNVQLLSCKMNEFAELLVDCTPRNPHLYRTPLDRLSILLEPLRSTRMLQFAMV